MILFLVLLVEASLIAGVLLYETTKDAPKVVRNVIAVIEFLCAITPLIIVAMGRLEESGPFIAAVISSVFAMSYFGLVLFYGSGKTS